MGAFRLKTVPGSRYRQIVACALNTGAFLLPDMACGHAITANTKAGTSRNGADSAMMGSKFIGKLDQIALAAKAQDDLGVAVIDRIAVKAVELEQAQQGISMIQKGDEIYVVRNVTTGIELGDRRFRFCYQRLEGFVHLIPLPSIRREIASSKW